MTLPPVIKNKTTPPELVLLTGMHPVSFNNQTGEHRVTVKERVGLSGCGWAVGCSPHVCCGSISVVPKHSACVSYSLAIWFFHKPLQRGASGSLQARLLLLHSVLGCREPSGQHDTEVRLWNNCQVTGRTVLKHINLSPILCIVLIYSYDIKLIIKKQTYNDCIFSCHCSYHIRSGKRKHTLLCWKQFSIYSTRLSRVSFLSCSGCRVPTEYILAFFLAICERCGLVAQREEKVIHEQLFKTLMIGCSFCLCSSS